MKLSKRWWVAAMVLLMAAGLIWRAVHSRQLARNHLQTAPAAAVLELSDRDVWTLQPVEFARTVEVSGGLKAVQSASLKAKVAAEILALTVREGDSVRAGQVVGQLDTTEFQWRVKQAEQSAASARSQWEIAQRTLNNNRALVAQGFISPTALETSLSNEAGAKATYEAAAAAVALARKSLADATLVAPISGQVAARLAQVGERVGVDAKILDLVDVGRLELEAALAPDDVAEVRVGQRAQLQVDGIHAPLNATVVRINPGAQVGSRSVLVYLSVQPDTAQTGVSLRQGLFARGTIKVHQEQTLAIPESVLKIDQAQPYVQILVNGHVEHRPVSVGQRGEMLVDRRPVPAVTVTADWHAGTPLLRANVGLVQPGTAVHWRQNGPTPASSPRSPQP